MRGATCSASGAYLRHSALDAPHMEGCMKVKTNLRAGAGKSTSVDSTTTTTDTTSSGANSGGVNSNKPVYVPPVYYGRCVGI